MKTETFADWLKRWPLVAILRGIKPGEALDVGAALVESGFCIVEASRFTNHFAAIRCFASIANL